MFSHIPPNNYFEEAVFQKEKERIFRHNWLFAGFLDSLRNHNDFITLKMLGTPVVIQNFKGEIKAFLNVCSHRFSLIQSAEQGNRPMMCPYHGWAYDSKGIPTGIPLKPLFKEYSKEELCELKLKEFQVGICGELVFFSIEPLTSLKEYLGSFYEEIESMSRSMGNHVDKNQMTINSNWKIIVENTLESYHVNLIHEQTFKKLGAKGMEFTFEGNHSAWDAELDISREDNVNRKMEKLFETREYKIDGYRHISIFPSLLIASTHGTSYNFIQVDPVSPSQTNFTSHVYSAKTHDKSSSAMLSAFENILIEFLRKLLNEDKEICEIVQKGVAYTQQPGVLSLIENRVHHFQKTYKEMIGE